jgi:AbiV family abortive infection protein
MSVTAQSLLKGAVYSLERCGELLCDANRLYHAGSYATAVALTLFAREELGRWRLLLHIRGEVVGGATLTVDEVRARCEDHVNKQRAGMTSQTMRTTSETGLGKLLQKRTAAASTPTSMEFQETSAQLEQIDQKLRKRTPDERHRLRMEALYVGIGETGDRWRRPSSEITKKQAYEVFTDALNDYDLMFKQWYLHPELFQNDDPELFTALIGWADRPTLPSVEHLPFES